VGSRLDLHTELLTFCPNVYFQPPSNIAMKYPCIVYAKNTKINLYGSDVVHFSKQEYRVTVIDSNPDSGISDQIEETLKYCSEYQRLTINNLNHTILSLYY
jgi:hypothetical protein